MERDSIMKCARLAGMVERYHTWPVHRKQNIGEHTWQLFRIYISIFGPPSPAVTRFMLWHDVGEFHTGDLPYPTKKKDPILAEKFNKMEQKAIEHMGGPADICVGTATYERSCIKLCDILDMWEHGLVEVGMGNQFAHCIVHDTMVDALQRSEFLLPPDRDAFEKYVKEMSDVLGVSKEDRAARRPISRAKGQVVRKQLEEERRHRGIHDAGQKVGPARGHDAGERVRRVQAHSGAAVGRQGRNRSRRGS